MMKKFAAVLLTFLMVMSLVACGNNSKPETVDTEQGVTNKPETTDTERGVTNKSETTDTEQGVTIKPETTDTEPTITSIPKTTTEPENNKGETKNLGTVSGEQEENPVNREDDYLEEGKKVLVAYFSATNTTKGIAELIADGLSADIYEIVPEEPYTDADLNYNDNNSRSTIEMNDPSARPVISGSVTNMEQYDIVFIGYPIWWGKAPRIIDTFMESYEFAEKTIVPFCTSGSSGIGSSATNLHNLCADNVTWLDGARLGGNSSREDIVEWINDLGLGVEAK